MNGRNPQSFEVLRPDLPRGRFRAALFDFDGTLSLLREGWPTVMTEMMLAELGRVGATEGDAELVEQIVVGMNGRPTIVQMQALAAEVVKRGGRPKNPTDYSVDYQKQLFRVIQGRYDDIQSGRVAAAAWVVPGSHAFLNELRERGIILALVSGTEENHVRHEADMLGLTRYFGEAIFAPAANDAKFSKRAVIDQALREHGLHGEELLGFGDGVVETEEMRHVGGVAVAVACEEPPKRGVNIAKRDRLIRAGADIVIADYECREPLLSWLFAEA